MPFLQIIITPTCYSVLILSRPSIDLYIYSDIVFEVQCTNFPEKKSLMGIKRHKIHQGSLCSFVLLGRYLPDIDFETKTIRLLPFDVKYMMQDPPCLMRISPGIWLQRCGAAKKKTSTYQRHTNRNARIYTCTLSPWNNILVYIYPICALLIYLNILTRIKTETPSLQCCSPTYK